MTIGIGVLGSDQRKPDHIILVSDTMGTYEEGIYSTSELHKGFAFPDVDLYAVAADSIDRAAELMATTYEGMLRLRSSRSYGDVVRTVIDCVQSYKLERFGLDCGPNLMFTRDQWFQVMDPEFRAEILQAWVEYNIGCEIIIGSFARNIPFDGQAFLLHISGFGKVTPINFPGVCAVGSGADNAMFWMSYRKHKLGVSVKRAAYHAYEAKLMAEKSSYVNERVEMIVAHTGKYWGLRHDALPEQGCPVSLLELQEMYIKYGPQKTDELDPPDQAGRRIY